MKKLLVFLLSILFFLHPVISFADVTQTIAVTAAVSPHASDFQLSIDSSPNAATTVNQFQNIVYTITYGSHLAYANPLTITASWAQGTINGQPSPSVDIADYVIGSASNAYNGTPPVVDTLNKTITWTIASLPANITDQTVSFTLQTNSAYTGAQTVTFPTTAHLTVTGTTIPDQSVTMTYLYNPAITPSPTPSPTETPTPTPTVLPTPTLLPSLSPSIAPTSPSGETTAPTNPTQGITITPTITPTIVITPGLTITSVSIDTISPTTATIHTTTNIPATVSLQYGTSLQALTLTSEKATGGSQFMHLQKLLPNTRYYFKVVAYSGQQSITSEIFTFITGSTAPTFKLDTSSLIVTSGSTLLYSVVENLNGNLHETIVLPVNKPFQFTFPVKANNTIKKIEAFIKNTSLSQEKIILFEIQPNVYQGLLTTNAVPGMYNLYIHVFDTNGNITEQQLFSIKVVRPLTIFSQQTKEPIDHAQITLSRLDLRTNKYVLVTSQMFAIQNPSYSDMQGEMPYVLPQGSYKVTINAFGYVPKTVPFTIGSAPGEDYPNIYLEKAGLSISSIENAFGVLFTELRFATITYFTTLGNSKELEAVVSSLAVICFLILSLLALRFRLHVNIFLLPWLLLYRSKRLLTTGSAVYGRVIDETQGFSLGHSIIIIIDADKNSIIGKTTTNAAGEFRFIPTDASTYKLSVERQGYEQHPYFEFSKESFSGTLLLPIKKEEEAVSIGMYVSEGMKGLLALSLEIILATTFLLEILSGLYLGWVSILPFLIISVVNFAIFAIDMHASKYTGYMINFNFLNK